MNTWRLSWIGLVVASGICLFFGVVGIVAGALRVTQEPFAFLGVGVTFLICALIVVRKGKRYESEVLPLAAEDLEAERNLEAPEV